MAVVTLKRFLVRLSSNGKWDATNYGEVANSISKLAKEKRSDLQIGNLRVATRAVEFDLLIENPADVPDIVDGLRQLGELLTVRMLDVGLPQKPEEDWVREGLQLFNEERFWECHEALEQVWKTAKGPTRDLLQGLILLAAAFVHHQKNESDVCLSILNRAITKLKDESGRFYRIDVDQIKREIDSILNSGNIAVFRI